MISTRTPTPWERINRDGPLPTIDGVSGACWLWLGSADKWGYGKFAATSIHRWMYQRLVGPIPEGLELDHLCFRPACCNPEHLEPVTGEENRRRKYARLTECSHGHPYTEQNTRISTFGRRVCRTCTRARSAAYKARKQGVAA